METRRWLNQSQPQTLVIAVLLLYFDAVLGLLFGGLFGPIGLAIIVGSVAAGYGIANERKWGYYLGVGMAVFRLLLLLGIGGLTYNLIALAFAIAKLALLLHPQSRDYQRIWFK